MHLPNRFNQNSHEKISVHVETIVRLLVETIRKLTTIENSKTQCNTPGNAQVEHRFLTKTSTTKNEKSFEEGCSHNLRTETAG